MVCFIGKNIHIVVLPIKTLGCIKVRGREDLASLIQVIFKIVMLESKQLFCLN